MVLPALTNVANRNFCAACSPFVRKSSVRPKARSGILTGYWYFVDLRRNQLLRLTPGKEPELVRTTIGGNGTTYLSSQTVARSWLT